MQPFSSLHAQARACAEASIPVFVCEAGGKKPITKNGFHDSTTDLATIDAWYAENPDYNLAICPDFVGVLVVDIDPGAPPEFIDTLPETYRVRTPRGGWHYYYEGSGPSTVSKLAQHVDTRGEGGYVLVPPSVVGGKCYQLAHDAPYQPVPDWVKTKLAVISTPVAAAIDDADLPQNIERAKAYLLREKPAIEFQGSDYRAYQIACGIRDFGISPETAFDLMWEHWIPRCEGTWTEDFVELKIQNAYQHGQNEAGAYGTESSEKTFGGTLKKLYPEVKSRFHFKDEAEQDEAEDANFIIPGLIVERSTVLLYGARASYKSLLAVDIMMGIATGKETFGVTPNITGPVFYGAHEGLGALRKHRKAWRIAKQVEGKVDFFLGRAPHVITQAEIIEFGDQIKRRCDALGKAPAMICLDTVAKCLLSMDENSAKDAGMFIQFVDSLVESFNCCILSVHHSGHEKGRARGSTAFEAGFDTLLEVKRHEDTKAVEVKMHKQKEAEEKENPWTFEAQKIGPSLVLSPTTKDHHMMLTGSGKKDNPLSPKIVGGALQAMKVFGPENAVTSSVVAEQLTITRENESIEERALAIDRVARALRQQAKDGGPLEGYTMRRGKSLVWFFPVQDKS